MEVEPKLSEGAFDLLQIEREAADWFAKKQGKIVTPDEGMAFEVWLNTSPAHRKAYRETEAFWRNQLFANALRDIPLTSEPMQCTPQRRRIPRIALATAASVLLVGFWLRAYQHCLLTDFCTAVGQTQRIELADGSAVTLASNSAMNVSLNNQSRHIQLLQGEAYFDVHRNPELPFVVDGRYSQTRVLGTRFLVRSDSASDTVTVIHGVVSVNRQQGKPAILRVNDQITVSDDTATGISQISSAQASAWISGHLVFENAPLEEVAAELSRYRKGIIFIKNNSLKKLKVSGRFNITETNKALDALEQTLPIKVYRLTPWLVTIT